VNLPLTILEERLDLLESYLMTLLKDIRPAWDFLAHSTVRPER
jgi:hypothetical protein